MDYLRSLPAFWSEAGPDARQVLATAIFARTDVTGFERLEYELTPDAIELGLDAALPAVFELSCTIAEFGRGERACPDKPGRPDLHVKRGEKLGRGSHGHRGRQRGEVDVTRDDHGSLGGGEGDQVVVAGILRANGWRLGWVRPTSAERPSHAT